MDNVEGDESGFSLVDDSYGVGVVFLSLEDDVLLEVEIFFLDLAVVVLDDDHLGGHVVA